MARARFNVKVTGVEATIKALREIGGSLTPSILSGVCARSLEPILEQAVSTAHVGDPATRKPGAVTIKESIRIRKLRANELRKQGVVAGAVVGSSSPKAHLVEYGTDNRVRRTKSGKKARTGRVTAEPFMRPAYEQNKEKVAQIAEVELAKAINRRVKRISKGTAKK